MKTDDKSTVPRVRIAVLGNVNVGKSALTVRYLTRRFIGEYRSNIDLLYKQKISIDNGLIEVEIVDISAVNEYDFPMEQIQWADACMIVYSIIDRKSYEYASRSLAELKSLQNAPVAYLVGNKSEMDHLREVTEKEGASLAATYSIGFCEISVAENTPTLYKSFERLLLDCRTRPVKQRKFSVSKMFGTLIGNSNSSSNGGTKQQQQQQNHNQHHNHYHQQHITINQGIVMPCHKGELHKSRVMKRRQAFMATASL